MSAIEEKITDVFGAILTRRSFIKGGGALVVGLSAAGAGLGAKEAKASAAGHSMDPTLPSSWFTINPDNTIIMRTGKAELGQGSASTAFAQIAAEELNVPYYAITEVIMADTDRTPDGGGSFAYMYLGAPNIRKAAAYTYQALLSVASTHLGVPVANLSVTNGVVSGGGKKVTYGQLVSGQQLNLTIPVFGDPSSFVGLFVIGDPPTKPVSQYQVIGQSIPMRTIPSIVSGMSTYVGDVRLPGMLHARVVHPPTLGSKLIAVGTLDKNKFPNSQVVVKNNLVAVLDPQEYVAIVAAVELARTTKWTTWEGLPGTGNLFGALRNLDWKTTPPAIGANVGNPAAALATAATKLSATYEFPYAKHAPIGPTAAVADVRSDGAVWVHAHGQNVAQGRAEFATMLNTSIDNVIVRNYEGSGHYGRSNGGNTGAEEEAIILSQAVGKPVRVQWMRWDDMQWSTQHPPVLSDIQAGLDSNGKLVAFNATHYMPAFQDDRPVGALLAGLPTQAPPTPTGPEPAKTTVNVIYDNWLYDQVPNALQTGLGTFQLGTDPSAPDFNQQIGLRGHQMRTPAQRQQNFAHESMMSELAAAAKIDPIQFRIDNTSTARLIAVLDAVKSAAGWETRPSPSTTAGTTGSKPLIGQGCSAMFREAYWACVVKVSVAPNTGKIRVLNVTSAVDPGVVVNPRQLKRMMEGGAVMGVSEALHEQVAFNKGAVTNADWVTFPILRIKDLPKIQTIVINNPSVGSIGGGGEGPNGFIAAAIANAVFDATGKQPRRLPLTPKYIRTLLSS